MGLLLLRVCFLLPNASNPTRQNSQRWHQMRVSHRKCLLQPSIPSEAVSYSTVRFRSLRKKMSHHYNKYDVTFSLKIVNNSAILRACQWYIFAETFQDNYTRFGVVTEALLKVPLLLRCNNVSLWVYCSTFRTISALKNAVFRRL